MDNINIIRNPDLLQIETEEGWVSLNLDRDIWEGRGITVTAVPHKRSVKVKLYSPQIAVKRILCSWKSKLSPGARILGDHWERGYGDLEWRGIVPQRIMPWYFLVNQRGSTHGFGVKTGTRSMSFWQVDSQAIRLCLDVRCGSRGVNLGDRVLEAAEVITGIGSDGESPFTAARNFCSLLCEKPVLPDFPVYGGNNWYYAYGKSSHTEIIRDSQLISSLSENPDNRPFMVVDDGWQIAWEGDAQNGGPWDRGNFRFPDMSGLAEDMKRTDVRPGIWFRPLKTVSTVPADFHRHEDRGVLLDPSIPEVLNLVGQDTARIADWGYELIKHDFSTFDIFGTWGFEMGSSLIKDAFVFNDRSKTTAEIILNLYRTIAENAGNALIIGCNTVSHLAAGVFAVQRTGDDTSGRIWERTRLMGINTLSHRMIQHNNFYACDADCVGLTKLIPWELNRQWLELLSKSGTPLFVSADPKSVNAKERVALKAAFNRASKPLPAAEPLDWMDTTCPAHWKLDGEKTTFEWFSERAIGGSEELIPKSLFH
jgi:alpha-galactosidase